MLSPFVFVLRLVPHLLGGLTYKTLTDVCVDVLR